jgi:hypothetical protein
MAQEEENSLLKNTVDEERKKVCVMVRRLGLRLSGLMLVCGFLVLLFGSYLLFAFSGSWFSPQLDFVLVGSLGFVGGLNILCGLLLLLGEEE